MPNEDLAKAIALVLEAARERIQSDPALRDAARTIVRFFADLAAEPSAPESTAEPRDTEAATVPPVLHVAEPSRYEPPPAIQGPKVSLNLRIGDSNPVEALVRGGSVVAMRPASEPVAEPPRLLRREPPPPEPTPDLEPVARSARWKAEACRLAGEAAESTSSAAKLEVVHQKIAQQRRAPPIGPGDLWMFDPARRRGGPRFMELAAQCYDNLASAADLAEKLAKGGQLVPGNGLEEAFQAIAEAQSAIRGFLNESAGEIDHDQETVFLWLRLMTGERHCRVLVQNYMRRGQIADSARAPELRGELERIAELWGRRIDGERLERRLLNKVRYKVKQARETSGDDLDKLWAGIDEVVAELVRGGMKPSNAGLREALGGLTPPSTFTPGEALALALRESVRAAGAHQQHDEDDDDPSTPEVALARQLLDGKRALLIGGEAREPQRLELEQRLGLRELIWLSTRDHESVARYEDWIRRPDVDLVLRLVRLTNHAHGELQDMAKRHGKIFVNLKAGYGVNRVAHDVLEQASERLTPPAHRAHAG